MRNLNRINLDGLRAVEAVGRLGGLRAAADEIGVTPGAISQRVRKAEQQLGCALFERQPKGMTLTRPGEEVMAQLSRGMSALSAAAALAARREENALTVSVAPVFAAKWLVWRLQGFHEAHPQVRIRIDATSAFVDPNVSDVNVCIRVGSGGWTGVRARKLSDQRIFPVCGRALAAQIRTPPDLAKVPIIRDRGTMFGWNTWLEPLGIDDRILNDGPVFSDASLCLDAAIAGQGVFLAWDTLACDAIASGRLSAPFPDRQLNDFSYWFVTAQYGQEPDSVHDFERWLSSELDASIKACWLA